MSPEGASAADIRARLCGLILDVLQVEVPSPDTDLIEDGLLDSLGLVALIAEIEAAFGLELPLDDFDIDRFRSVAHMAAFVQACQPAETPV